MSEALSSARKERTETSTRTITFSHSFQFRGSIGSAEGCGTSGNP